MPAFTANDHTTFQATRPRSVLERLAGQPRVALGKWPTPLERYSGRAIWIKRDDLSGFGRGGAKARKLEYLLGYIERNGYDEIITVTGNVTNLVFDLRVAAAARGLRTRILIVNYPRATREDREALFAPVREHAELLESGASRAAAAAAAAWAACRRRGGHPFLLLPGAAHPASVVGNACGLLELGDQLTSIGKRAATVFITVATGTSVAGLLLGATMLARCGGPRIRIVGVAVDRAPLVATTLALIRWTERRLKLQHRVPRAELLLLGPGPVRFAGRDPSVAALCERIAAQYGIALDPIFGGRTWAAMEQALADSRRAYDEPMIFWHCGFTAEWRALTRTAAGSALGVS
jgi:1-aminocyclopropane-1-carboxylate deaminase/D-cysteine desulfhydrase-like pyridoxal-dependent ACC family enzyme